MTKYFEQRLDEENIKSRKIAWCAFAVMTLVAVLLTLTILRLAPLKRTEVKVLVVDKNTGMPSEVTALTDFETGNIKGITGAEALNKFFTNQYIVAHDSYNFYAIRDAYATVALYSTEQVFNEYKQKFEPPISIEKQLGTGRNLDVTVHSITQEAITTPFKDTENGITMRARIEKVIREGNQNLSRETGTVIITFGYDADVEMDEKARNTNPFGFTVTSYHFTPDMSSGSMQ